MDSASRAASMLLLIFLPSVLVGAASASSDTLNQSGELITRGGPWFVGDTIELSVLVHNNGSTVDEVHLSAEFNGMNVSGNSVMIEPGSSTELTPEHGLTQAGTINFTWMVSDASSNERFSGEESIEVDQSQTLTISIASATHDYPAGLTIGWEVSLSSGKSRLVEAVFSFSNDAGSVVSASPSIEISPGSRTLSHSLGDAPVGFDSVVLTLNTVGWSPPASAEATVSIPTAIDVDIEINSIEPSTPMRGEAVTLKVQVTNDGAGTVYGNNIVIVDGQKRLLAQSQASLLEAGEVGEYTFEFEWASSSTTTLEALWYGEGAIRSDSLEVISLNSVGPATSTNFDVAWTQVLLGILGAAVIIMSVRMMTAWRASAGGAKQTRTFSERSKRRESLETKPAEDKREISCPACERELRVPADYTGQVKCPSCRVQFSSLADHAEEEPSSDESIKEQTDSAMHSASSDDDIIGCPNCDQVLRVPYDKRPAKARCPSCSTIFNALAL